MTKSFDLNHFANPSAPYRGVPFWSWNCKLSWPELKEQIDQMEEMGMGGFHMHSRVGLDTPYLGEEFMGLVKQCVAYAKDKGLQACLYDEDRWPSGAAGGLAIKGKPQFKAKHLLITPRPYGSTTETSTRASAKASRSENGRLIARVDLELHPGGLVTYTHLPPSTDAPPTKLTRYIYLESNPPSAWYNGETYVDTLNPDAIAAFIDLTHETYKAAVGSEFGGTVPSMFTDEPQHSHRSMLKDPADESDLFLPWTDNLPETFAKATGRDDLVEKLAEILWDVKGKEQQGAQRRWEFANHVTERFVAATMDQMANWCKKNGIQQTGHLMNEPTLLSQTLAVGECMRGYRNMDMPGVDMLCERIELNTVKQAASVARQNKGGPAWVLSELYGVTNWSMTFAEHKRLGDWQVALGVTRRVHHLAPVSLRGEGKRDYPAAISYQSPWYKEYSYIEDHFSRVNLAMTTGHAVTRVAVIHPIESFWMCFGPMKRNMPEMSERDTMFKELTEWLLYGLIDFDFVAESLLPSQIRESSDGQLKVGHCVYDVVIVPGLKTIRQTTVDILNRFTSAGGRVIVAGSEPTYIDAYKPAKGELQGERLGLNRFAILNALEQHRDLAIADANGLPAKTLLHQLRAVDNEKLLFVSNLDRREGVDSTVSVRGEYTVDVLDTFTGKEWRIASDLVDGFTAFAWEFEPAGSLLVRLAPRTTSSGEMQVRPKIDYEQHAAVSLDEVVLSEPNVLLLDYAEFAVDGGPWEPRTEVLRIGNTVRERKGLPIIGEAAAQPWSIPDEDRAPRCKVDLKFTFESAIAVDTPVELAIELADGFTVKLDGKDVATTASGWWVDKAISRVPLAPRLAAGLHTIEIGIPFGRLSATERIYVLGDFGVDVRGDRAIVTKLEKRNLFWGDWTRQGLPFYAGNVTYRSTLSLSRSGPAVIHVPQYHGPVVTVSLPDKGIKRTIAHTATYADLGTLSAGDHAVEITCFGNRDNAFGMLHHAPGKTHWCSPNEFRTAGDEWVDEYQIKPMGIVTAPRVRLEKTVKGKVPAPLIRDRAIHIILADPVGGPILAVKPL